MTEANKTGKPLGLASTAELGLVERLRDWADERYVMQRGELAALRADLREAAAEIERLRFELGYAQGQINQADSDKAKAVAAERERLCEALKIEMQHSAWDGVLQLDDALLNIEDLKA